MPGIKKLDLFILKSYALLFLGTFLICLFIFMMQFLWRYVDELVGKGLEMTVLAQFFYFSALTLVPVSLPLAILLASLITFGNFGERYELLAMKAAGISLSRIMRPVMFFAIFLAGVSFYFQNITGPQAQAKLWTLIISMKQKSPELDIPEGVFYDEIKGYNLYVNKKNRKNGLLYNIMVYNFSDGFDNARIIVADSGRMEMTADKKHLYFYLYDGEQFENLKSQNMSAKNVPYRREAFREKHILQDFDAEFSMVDGSFMNDQSISKNLWQLQSSIDSLSTRIDSIGRQYHAQSRTNYNINKPSEKDSLKLAEEKNPTINLDSLFNAYTLAQKRRVVTSAKGRSENVGNDWDFKSYPTIEGDKNLRRHQTEWHNKITLSLACIIFFFIGAPLGAIIRKGGLGMPVIISVLIFIIYYVINNTGYKMARDGNWEVWIGMWTSTMILAPLGAFLTYKSNSDSVVFNMDVYTAWFKRLVGIRDTRHITKKEVIIEDPSYETAYIQLLGLEKVSTEYLATHRLTSPPNYIKIWRRSSQDKAISVLNEKMEEIIELLANSTSTPVLNELNNFPIIAEYAHKSPFRNKWLNFMAAIFLPLGLLFYFRIWLFRIRLQKDLNQIIKTSKTLEDIIKNNQY